MSCAETLQRKRYRGNSDESIAPVCEFFLEIYSSTRESVDAAVDTENGVRRMHKESPEFPSMDAFCQKNYQGDDSEDFKGLEDPDSYLTTNKDKNIVGTLGGNSSESIVSAHEFFLGIYNSAKESVDMAADTENGVRRIYKESPEFLLVNAFCKRNYQGGDILDEGRDFRNLNNPDFYLTTNEGENFIGTLGVRKSETPTELKDLNPEGKNAFEIMRTSHDKDKGMKTMIKSMRQLFRRVVDFLCLQTKQGDTEDLFIWMLSYEKFIRGFATANRIKDLFVHTKKTLSPDSMPPECRCFFKKGVEFFFINNKSKQWREMFLGSRTRQDRLLRDLLNQRLK